MSTFYTKNHIIPKHYRIKLILVLYKQNKCPPDLSEGHYILAYEPTLSVKPNKSICIIKISFAVRLFRLPDIN